MYITDKNSVDPAGKFEDLARFTFDYCPKYGDPWGYAAQEVYDTFLQGIDVKGKRILSTILVVLIYKYGTTKICENLKQIEESIWEATLQQDAVNIILNTIQELERIED